MKSEIVKRLDQIFGTRELGERIDLIYPHPQNLPEPGGLPPARRAMYPEELDSAHAITKEFYQTYQKLAPTYGYEAPRMLWEDLLPNYKLLMVGIIAELLDRGVIFDTKMVT